MLLRPDPLPDNYQTRLPANTIERSFQLTDGTVLHGVQLKNDSPRGLIFYNHGNSGNILDYLDEVEPFAKLGYEVLLYDYRGYGKSEGQIYSEEMLYADARELYQIMLTEFDETDVIVMGYSLGSGIAAHTACVNQPKHLILNAPYDDIIDLFPAIPNFISRIHLDTGKAFENCAVPSTIFHGRDDDLIPMSHAVRLSEQWSQSNQLVLLDGVGHGGLELHPLFLQTVQEILE